MRRYLMLVVTLSLLVLAACQPVSPEQANADFCADLEAYKTALTSLTTLTPESTVQETNVVLGTVDEARENLQDSARILADVRLDDLDEAYEDMDDAIRDISETDTISSAVTTIQDQVANVSAAYDELFAGNCE